MTVLHRMSVRKIFIGGMKMYLDKIFNSGGFNHGPGNSPFQGYNYNNYNYNNKPNYNPNYYPNNNNWNYNTNPGIDYYGPTFNNGPLYPNQNNYSNGGHKDPSPTITNAQSHIITSDNNATSSKVISEIESVIGPDAVTCKFGKMKIFASIVPPIQDVNTARRYVNGIALKYLPGSHCIIYEEPPLNGLYTFSISLEPCIMSNGTTVPCMRLDTGLAQLKIISSIISKSVNIQPSSVIECDLFGYSTVTQYQETRKQWTSLGVWNELSTLSVEPTSIENCHEFDPSRSKMTGPDVSSSAMFSTFTFKFDSRKLNHNSRIFSSRLLGLMYQLSCIV